MIVYLDMDGVLVDWAEGVCGLYNIDPSIPECREILRSANRMLNGWLFGTDDDVDNKIYTAGYDFWYNLKELPWSRDLIDLCSKYGEVHFLTAPGRFHAGAHAKCDYIWNRWKSRNYILTKNKYLCAKKDTLLIDDLLKNTTKFEIAGGNSFCWPNQYLLMEDPQLLQTTMDRLEEKLKRISGC